MYPIYQLNPVLETEWIIGPYLIRLPKLHFGDTLSKKRRALLKTDIALARKNRPTDSRMSMTFRAISYQRKGSPKEVHQKVQDVISKYPGAKSTFVLADGRVLYGVVDTVIFKELDRSRFEMTVEFEIAVDLKPLGRMAVE